MDRNDMWMNEAACRRYSKLFSSPALDYDPSDEDYAHLSAQEHARAADRKAKAEQAAASICFGCPVLAKCEAWVRRMTREGRPVAGVVAGYTEAQRAAWTTSRRVVQVTVTPRDRGPRGKVNDAAVMRLTKLGYSAEQIARELGCTARTVVRARARLRARAAGCAATSTHTTTVTLPARQTCGGMRKRPSVAMQAIYRVLADGHWHSIEDLAAVGMRHITPDEGHRVVGDHTLDQDLGWSEDPRSGEGGGGSCTRIAKGARGKVLNMISAAARNAGYIQRGGPDGADVNLCRLTPKGAVFVRALLGTPQVTPIAA